MREPAVAFPVSFHLYSVDGRGDAEGEKVEKHYLVLFKAPCPETVRCSRNLLPPGFTGGFKLCEGFGTCLALVVLVSVVVVIVFLFRLITLAGLARKGHVARAQRHTGKLGDTFRGNRDFLLTRHAPAHGRGKTMHERGYKRLQEET